MKIANGRNNATKEFSFIDAGTVFMLDDGCYYMKIYAIEASNYSFYNVVRLADGETFRISDDKMVILVDCELVIK